MAARFGGSIKRNLSCQCGIIKARNSREINFFRSCTDERLYCIGLWNVTFDGPKVLLHSIICMSEKSPVATATLLLLVFLLFRLLVQRIRFHRAILIFHHADFSESLGVSISITYATRQLIQLNYRQWIIYWRDYRKFNIITARHVVFILMYNFMNVSYLTYLTIWHVIYYELV